MKRILSFALGLALCASAAFGQYNAVGINTNTGLVRPSNVAWSFGDSNSIMNVVTGEFDVLCLGGVCITNWVQSSVVTPGEITLEFKYPTSGKYVSGTLYAYAWNNKEMYGSPVFSTNWTVTRLSDQPTKTVANAAVFISNIWWYAWMDTDADGILNHHNTFYDDFAENNEFGSEPAALGEHMPLFITNADNTATCRFWMTDWQKATPRYGWDDVGRIKDWMQIQNLGLAGAPTWANGTNLNRNFWIETDFYYNDYFNRNDAGVTLVAGWGATNLDYSFQAFIMKINNSFQSNFTFNINFESKAVSTPAAPVPVYPIGGETVTTATIEFQWTNDYKLYPGMGIEIRRAATGGTVWHDYYGYMENERYDDGTTRYLYRPTHRQYNRSSTVNSGKGYALTGPTNYFWRIQVLPPRVGDHWPSGTKSGWQEFWYEP